MRGRHFRNVVKVLVALWLSGCATHTATLRLTPLFEQGALQVELSVPLDGAPVFRLEDRVFGSAGMAALISDVRAHDDAGELPLTRVGELELVAARPAKGVVTLQYRARSIAVSEPGARFGLRHDATGIGGLGAFFLVLPDGHEALRSAAYFFPLSPRGRGSGRGHTDAEHFRASWFGNPSFDTAVAGDWAERAFEAEREFFGDTDKTPYEVFVRVLPSMGARANGMGQLKSLISAIGPRTPFGPRLRTNLAHEMLHRWLGLQLRLAGPDGSNFWFTEGFTVHYAAVLMLRAKLISQEEFLSEVNGIVTRHFANDQSGASNDEIRRGFFEDDDLSVVPYTRGALYAAELDGAIRRASGGRRSLDDLIRSLGTKELPASAFRDAVFRELGQTGVDRFDAVITRGEAPNPPADAYGPSFTRKQRMIARYELGFDDRAPAIRNLLNGSAARCAGLVEGDQVVSVEATPLFSDREVVVTVNRAGKEIVVRYLPARAGSDQQAWEWVAAEKAP